MIGFIFALLLLMPGAGNAGRITLEVHGAAIADVIALLAAQSGRNVVADDSIGQERVTLRLRDVTFTQALDALADSYGLQVHRDGSVLIVGSSTSMSRRYAGSSDDRGARTAILTFDRADPTDVAHELSASLPDGTVVVPDKRTASVIVSGAPEAVLRARSLAAALDAPAYGKDAAGVAHVYPLRFQKASDVAADLKGVLPDGSFIADDAQNAIIVSGSAQVQRTAVRFLRSLDVPSAQVLFEVRVADLTPVNDASDVGVIFGGIDLNAQPEQGATSWSFASNTMAVNASLNAMVSQGHAEILATPKLVTLNNKEADLLIGQTYPVVYYDAHFGGQQVQFEDIGVKLRLTPTIGPDGSVTAEMHPEYSAIEGFAGGYPIIANRKIDSTLRVADNQTIVLGGLMRDVSSETLTKLPGLSDIPVIGKIFQDKQRTHERDEVVFFITPHVIYPNASPPSK